MKGYTVCLNWLPCSTTRTKTKFDPLGTKYNLILIKEHAHKLSIPSRDKRPSPSLDKVSAMESKACACLKFYPGVRKLVHNKHYCDRIK